MLSNLANHLRRVYYSTRAMADKSILYPPSAVKGMQKLDKSQFAKRITVPGLAVDPTGLKMHQLLSLLKPKMLKLRQFRPVIENVESGEKLILLHPELVKRWNDLPGEELLSHKITEDDLKSHEFEINYENYPLKDLLSSVLPDEVEGVSSFSQIGHIVHVNLRDEVLQFKGIIGQILLENVSNCKTVVNKTNNIDTVYRNFELELLAGEDNYQVVVKEHGVQFEFDFSKVYWNPRLSTEHERMVKIVEKGDIVYDIFAGVGPFSIPIAKRLKCKVLANDLNPESAKWLEQNKKKNKIGDNLTIFNKDGKDFILKEIKEDLLSELTSPNSKTIHIIMNLPEIGKTFLKHFIGLFNEQELTNWNSKIIKLQANVYLFVRGEDLEKEAKKDVEEQIETELTPEILKSIHFVRNVAPKKDMMKVSFLLTKEILSKTNTALKRSLEGSEDVVPTKQICL